MGRSRVLIIIPTDNEAGNNDKFVRGIISPGQESRPLIVDDNSPDGTFERV